MLKKESIRRYQFRVTDQQGTQAMVHDPYAFPPLPPNSTCICSTRRHRNSYHRLGAQLRAIDGVEGVNFAVWAPTPPA